MGRGGEEGGAQGLKVMASATRRAHDVDSPVSSEDSATPHDGRLIKMCQI